VIIDRLPSPDDDPEEFARVVEEVQRDEAKEIADGNPPTWDVHRRARHRLRMRRWHADRQRNVQEVPKTD